MDRYIKIILVVYICFVLSMLINFGDANQTQTVVRHKRYLGFGNTSQFFNSITSANMSNQVRLNFKANMVPWTQIFAQALGFRMNWEEPPDSFHPHHHLSRRDVFNNLEILLDKNGLNGFDCVRRAICEVNLISEHQGIYLKILKMIFRKQSQTADKWYTFTDEDCRLSINSCPFSVLEISSYTDL